MTSETTTRIASRTDFHDAVRTSLAHAADIGAREIRLVDPDFTDWPLGERAVIDSLTRWVHSSRSLVVFAGDFAELARRQIRFVEWRRQWAHVVQCRSDPELQGEALPTMLHVPGLVCVRLLDRVHYRGSVSNKSVDGVACREIVDALLQRSVEAFPVTTLGL